MASMLQRIIQYFAKPKTNIRYIPSSPALPELWPANARSARLVTLDDASPSVLMDLCDDYWNSFLEPDGDMMPTIRDRDVVTRSLEILGLQNLEPATLSWARARLKHPGYDAREDAASFIGNLAQRNWLGKEKDPIAQELVTLAVTPWLEDPKETQASTAAIQSLLVLGGPALMEAIRKVLNSKEWEGDDHQFNCACVLGDLIKQPFMSAKDPVAAAKDWLAEQNQS